MDEDNIWMSERRDGDINQSMDGCSEGWIKENEQMDDGDKLTNGWIEGQFDERKEVVKNDAWLDGCMIM